MPGASDKSGEISTVRINIEGMSCQNCVKNIEGTIGARPDVVNIRVVLEEKAGYIDYKNDETSPCKLAEAISDMGFNAFISEERTDNPESNDRDIQPVNSTCSIRIDGMTCSSCVNSITGERYRL